VCIIANALLICFSWSFFSDLSGMLNLLGSLQIAVVWLDKYPPSWKLQHDWLESLAIELADIFDT